MGGFIRISADLVVTSDIPVNEYGPDGRQGVLLRGALDNRLDLCSGDPDPEQAEMVCTTAMAVVTAAPEGGLLSPLRECAMYGASAQNGINHNRMSDTPTRRRNGDR